MPDSGIMHVLAVLGKPVAAVFGNVIPPEYRVSAYDSLIPLKTPLVANRFDFSLYSKQPYCWLNCCYDSLDGSCYQTAHYKWCTNEISPEKVMETFDEICSSTNSVWQ